MSRFKTSDDVYKTIGAFLVSLARSGGIGPRLAKSNSTVAFSVTAPSAAIAVLPRGGSSEVRFGSEPAVPDTIVKASAEVFHSLFLGQTTLAGEIASGRLTVRGNTEPLVSTWDALTFAGPLCYSALLRSLNLGDFLAGA